MGGFLAITRVIDIILSYVARIGAFSGLCLVLVVVFDVITRKMGLNKADLFGVNSTQVQESEFWLHTFLFSLVIGYAYTRQAHVRIDLVRDHFPIKVKYAIELAGCLLFLLPIAIFMIQVHTLYVIASYGEGEISVSLTGLTNIWIHKSMLVVMFVLLVAAGISQTIKALAGLIGHLPDDKIAETLGGDN